MVESEVENNRLVQVYSKAIGPAIMSSSTASLRDQNVSLIVNEYSFLEPRGLRHLRE